MNVTGDGKVQFCPRCGAAHLVKLPVGKCSGCTWEMLWVGPLWGQAMERTRSVVSHRVQ
jgi:tRNA G26 N,N-dimethylase Trm1